MVFVLYILKMGKVVRSMPGTSWEGIPKGWKAERSMPGTRGGGIPKGRKVVTGMLKMVYVIRFFSCFRE